MKILFVQTGGTIDKDYPKTTNGQGFEIGDPAFSRLLERLNPSFRYEFHTVCQKDSLEITDQDRESILEQIDDRLEEGIQDGCAFDGIVITHGTDTMAETARFLGNVEFIYGNPRIVITGAMRPERFSNSDADCNLGMAIAAVQILPEGFVGICMHGMVLRHNEIARDLSTGKFFRKAGPGIHSGDRSYSSHSSHNGGRLVVPAHPSLQVETWGAARSPQQPTHMVEAYPMEGPDEAQAYSVEQLRAEAFTL